MATTLSDLEREHADLSGRLSDPEVNKDRQEFVRLARRHAEVSELLELHRTISSEKKTIAELEGLLTEAGDDSVGKLAADELPTHRQALAKAEAALTELNRPRDKRDGKNAIIEIRAGAGGDESTLFASELYGMYSRYAERRRWNIELYSSSASEAGGFKEIIFEVAGEGAYGAMKFEAGTHRVQRVPATESQGRVHTSTVTVAVLPEAEEEDIDIKPEDIRIDVFRSSGPGGQSVNTTDSAVRITHQETGLVVSCQDEKSQHKNRAKALAILRARLVALKEEEIAKERGDARRAQVGTGERSEKIRTYNFPQDRLTDHRINYTTHGLNKILSGEMDGLLDALRTAAAADDA